MRVSRCSPELSGAERLPVSYTKHLSAKQSLQKIFNPTLNLRAVPASKIQIYTQDPFYPPTIMKNYLSRTGLLLLTAVALNFTACKKMTEETKNDPNETATQDNTSALYESDDAVGLSENVMREKNTEMARTSEGNRETSVTQSQAVCGATVTFTPVNKTNNTPGSIVIDFGTGKTCSDGRIRKGKILISFTGKYQEAGKTQIITFDNYSVNDNKVEGKKTLTHVVEGNTKIITTIKVENAKITYTDGTIVSWNSNRLRTYDTKGTITDLNDDELTVTGTFDGVTKKGKSYTAIVDPATPLLYKYACLATSGTFPVSGKLTVTPQGLQARVIDYGTGTCDKKATITVGNVVIDYEQK
jgi:hypothetical protein